MTSPLARRLSLAARLTIALWATTACGRIEYEEVDGVEPPCESVEKLSLGRPATTSGETFPESAPSEAVDGIIDTFGGYWACQLNCSLFIDLESSSRLEALELRPGGNALPSIYYLQQEWRVQFATAEAPDQWRDFEQVVMEAGAGDLAPGIHLRNGWPANYLDDPSRRFPDREFYRFRFAPITARYLRFDGLEGDRDGDTNVDEITALGCSRP
jgi:hypothetical protein